MTRLHCPTIGNRQHTLTPNETCVRALIATISDCSTSNIAAALQITHMYAQTITRHLLEKGYIVRIRPGIFALAPSSKSPSSTSAPDSAFIRPPTKARLMGGRA